MRKKHLEELRSIQFLPGENREVQLISRLCEHEMFFSVKGPFLIPLEEGSELSFKLKRTTVTVVFE
jgi:hypothetical protein